MTAFTISPQGPFSLAESTAFLEGFAPAAHEGDAAGHLHLAFVADAVEADGGGDPAGVCLRQPGGGDVLGELYGSADPQVVRAQVARILSLDVDGSGFPEVGRRDPVVGRLQAAHPGLRPVCFFSPYEAAAWTLIGQRIRITQAARIKARMAAELGPEVDIHGDRQHAFPAPARLARIESFPGLPDRKVQYLRALGEAAVAGRLDAAMLRSLPVGEALARLRELPGIGDFSAELILLRGAGHPDHLPSHEPRLRRAVALVYGPDALPGGPDAPSGEAELAALADAWRPYRTWVCLLLRARLEEETHEIAGRAGQAQAASPSSAGLATPGWRGTTRTV